MGLVIVGWKLTDDETCRCGNPATVIVEEDGYHVYPACDDCVPPGASDPIAEVFAKAFLKAKQEQDRG